jgi:hypothetical protein
MNISEAKRMISNPSTPAEHVKGMRALRLIHGQRIALKSKKEIETLKENKKISVYKIINSNLTVVKTVSLDRQISDKAPSKYIIILKLQPRIVKFYNQKGLIPPFVDVHDMSWREDLTTVEFSFITQPSNRRGKSGVSTAGPNLYRLVTGISYSSTHEPTKGKRGPIVNRLAPEKRSKIKISELRRLLVSGKGFTISQADEQIKKNFVDRLILAGLLPLNFSMPKSHGKNYRPVKVKKEIKSCKNRGAYGWYYYIRSLYLV